MFRNASIVSPVPRIVSVPKSKTRPRIDWLTSTLSIFAMLISVVYRCTKPVFQVVFAGGHDEGMDCSSESSRRRRPLACPPAPEGGCRGAIRQSPAGGRQPRCRGDGG